MQKTSILIGVGKVLTFELIYGSEFFTIDGVSRQMILETQESRNNILSLLHVDDPIQSIHDAREIISCCKSENKLMSVFKETISSHSLVYTFYKVDYSLVPLFAHSLFYKETTTTDMRDAIIDLVEMIREHDLMGQVNRCFVRFVDGVLIKQFIKHVENVERGENVIMLQIY